MDPFVVKLVTEDDCCDVLGDYWSALAVAIKAVTRTRPQLSRKSSTAIAPLSYLSSSLYGLELVDYHHPRPHPLAAHDTLDHERFLSILTPPGSRRTRTGTRRRAANLCQSTGQHGPQQEYRRHTNATVSTERRDARESCASRDSFPTSSWTSSPNPLK